jgi:hypothetical protein
LRVRVFVQAPQRRAGTHRARQRISSRKWIRGVRSLSQVQ